MRLCTFRDMLLPSEATDVIVINVFGEGDGLDYRERLKELRKSRNLSQKQFGKIIFKSQQGYSHIENGRANLKIDDIKILCSFLGISADYLIGLTDNPNHPCDE